MVSEGSGGACSPAPFANERDTPSRAERFDVHTQVTADHSDTWVWTFKRSALDGVLLYIFRNSVGHSENGALPGYEVSTRLPRQWHRFRETPFRVKQISFRDEMPFVRKRTTFCERKVVVS